MIGESSTVFVIDDDDSLRTALERLLRTKGYRVAAFSSAEAFLEQNFPAQIACLILDLQLPGLNGLELQNTLVRRNIFLPTVFISGHGSIPTAVQAVKSGAIGFLTKPFTENQMMAEVESALATCRKEFKDHSDLADLQQRFENLTKREGEILAYVVNGKLNKQTASDLGLDINTVKVHRRHVMRKMHAESLADLVVMAQKLGMTSHLPSFQSASDHPAQVLTLPAGPKESPHACP